MAAPPPAQQAQASAPAPPARPEPGSYDLLHNEYRGLLAANFAFEGARFSFSKPVGQHMQLQHQVHLGKEPAYHFTPTYVGTLQQLSPSEMSPIVMADLDHKGSLTAQIVYDWSRQLRSRLQIQTDGAEYKGVQVETDYDGADFHVGLKAVNVDPLNSRGIWVFNYLQKITQRLALGGECMWQYGPGGQQAIPSFGGRYRGANNTTSVTMSPMGVLEASYQHDYSDTIALGTNFELNLAQASCTANVGFQSRFSSAMVRGQVSTAGVITSVYEKTLAPGVNFTVSAILDHLKGDSAFGLGLTIGQ